MSDPGQIFFSRRNDPDPFFLEGLFRIRRLDFDPDKRQWDPKALGVDVYGCTQGRSMEGSRLHSAR